MTHLIHFLGVSHELHHIDYWGTRQQLRAGKVISDWIDKKYGSIDPVFGALLSPAAGKVGFEGFVFGLQRAFERIKTIVRENR